MKDIEHLINCLLAAKGKPDDLSTIIPMLAAISRYLDNIPEISTCDLTSPLIHLAADIHDIKEGRTPQHFKTTGKRGTTSRTEARQGHAVGTINALIATGMSASEATKDVARLFDKAGFGRLGDTAVLLGGWRRELRDDPERYIFRGIGERVISTYQLDPEQTQEQQRKFIKDGLKALLKT